jgi:hypothetical protein
VTRLDGLEHQCLFDVTFVTKWVRPRETLFACSDGKMWLGGFVLCWRLKGGFERTWFARLSSRPLRWMTGLSYVEWMSPAMWEAYSKQTGPRCVFAFEALCRPFVTSLSDVEGGGLLADGQT